MYRIQQIKLPIDHKEEELLIKAAEALRIKKEEIKEISIFRKSIDARKKDEILFIYTLDVDTYKEVKISKRNNNISVAEPFIYDVQATGEKPLNNRPVVVGSGPAGLFCALLLAEKGYRPIILERGKTVKERVKDVEKFWKEGILLLTSSIELLSEFIIVVWSIVPNVFLTALYTIASIRFSISDILDTVLINV
jgi:uncharacterized FAD-dependent dehydrogenase